MSGLMIVGQLPKDSDICATVNSSYVMVAVTLELYQLYLMALSAMLRQPQRMIYARALADMLGNNTKHGQGCLVRKSYCTAENSLPLPVGPL